MFINNDLIRNVKGNASSDKFSRFKRMFRNILIFIAGIFIGWLIFHSSEIKTTVNAEKQEVKKIFWTCSMHPQVKLDHAGLCPVCGMDLVPLESLNPANQDSSAIHFTKEAAAIANVETWTVKRLSPQKEINLLGTIEPDERHILSQVAHFGGRVEKLRINFTGERVFKGQPLAEIYSSELITAQQELLEAYANRTQHPEIYQAVREKLLQWKLTSAQIEKIEKNGSVQNLIEIVSDFSGVVTTKNKNVGDYISKGDVLFEISDLSNIWVVFDVYEDDLPFVKVNDKLTFSVQALPGQKFTGSVSFIEPVLNTGARVSKIRVELNNMSGLLKPGMFVTGNLMAALPVFKNKLVVPRSAVLWTGKRSVVYIKFPGTDQSVFKLREIELGPLAGNFYVIDAGLEDGDDVVVNGAFSIDAASQLEGKPNMLNFEN